MLFLVYTENAYWTFKNLFKPHLLSIYILWLFQIERITSVFPHSSYPGCTYHALMKLFPYQYISVRSLGFTCPQGLWITHHYTSSIKHIKTYLVLNDCRMNKLSVVWYSFQWLFSLHKKNKIATTLDTRSANILFFPEKYFCILIKQSSSP